MQQPSNISELMSAIDSRIQPISRQLERMEERMEQRTRDLVTRTDLEALRKELVARDSLEPQLNALKMQITRVDKDRADDRKELDRRMDGIETDQVSKQDRLWIRLGQAVAFAAFILALFDFLSRLRIQP
jgi:hypothetical protein